MDLWAIARYDLRLSDEQFGRLTPGLFDLLLLRKQEDDRKKWMRAATITAAVINFSMCHPDRTVDRMEFVPTIKEEEIDLTKLSSEEQAARIIGQFSKKSYSK